MFYLRVDGNQTIASGHVMRCMAIAGQIEKMGESCVFITADEEPKRLIEENGFSVRCLHTSWSDMEGELPTLLTLIKECNIKKLLVDSYFITPRYLEQLKEVVSVFYMDDLNRFLYPVDTLINYGIQYPLYHYEENYKESGTTLLLGCDYIPLREEFQGIKPRLSGKVKNILITTGGTDPFRMEIEIFEKLKEKDCCFYIICGAMNGNYEELHKLEKKYKNVRIYKNVKKMTDIMKACDLAISAGGTTLYELAACGLPTVSFSFTDNPIEGAQEFAKQKIIPYAGDARNGMETCCQTIALSIEELEKDYENRKQISLKMQKLIDGNGAERIAARCVQAEERNED
ncbi:MAG: UDP-2,4-diacetamido-2,4,6-trideoxy-beta-L-altropyranose hydrolase [Acetivibrio sp.]